MGKKFRTDVPNWTEADGFIQEDIKICPMAFGMTNMQACVEKKCAWWATYMVSTDQEWSECVIMALGRIYDLPTG
jgi:hypothetical protein